MFLEIDPILASSAVPVRSVFEQICDDLSTTGFSICPFSLPSSMAYKLREYAMSLNQETFVQAGVGRKQNHSLQLEIRNDRIFWLNGKNEIEVLWLDWIEQMRVSINQHLYLGLFSFESHIACYQPGQFYLRHRDAFNGNTNRKLSIVVYLNDEWQPTDGGELVIYKDDDYLVGTKVLPQLATVAVFLSERFPHEVLPATRSRLSIAGWFRVNN